MEENSRIHHTITRIGMELALAVNDYNSFSTDSLEEVTKLTLAYLQTIKNALASKNLSSEDLNSYFALVGQTWGSIQPRFENEYLPK